jgi:formylglycine-generating enzyme required for sulfatase activity
MGWLVMLVLATFAAEQARTPVMVRIDACTFTMGRDNAGDESPAHRVTLSAYQLGKYDVTNADFVNPMGFAAFPIPRR